ncbi:phosphatase PAP2 family protein [Sphingobium phenoxybenzoativorans]|uniref:Phosphatase PAP2 family protein n=1 Tax=Sphingobium phenoxybenzoativorans TaxID=1592790 RepID=A0A975K3W5_9SPHN|nr:phosphatase PAP2 family protein [Sphingobium phenoxybenzoativorans]QUT04388.1 phosphatase PAP2 family protein [Sphingobium phenoxybenzoativorans]
MTLFERVSKREHAIVRLNLIIALAFALFVVAQPAVPTWEFLRLIGTFLLLTIPLSALSLLGFALLNARGPGMLAALQDRWRSDRFVTLLWPVLLFAIVMSSFSAFKQRILPHAGFHFDPALAAIDRSIFGVDLGLWLHKIIGSPLLTYFLDGVYHAWFLPMSVGVGIVALCTDARTRMQYMTAFTMTWIGLGSILAYLLPAAGPCFYGVLVGPIGNGPFEAVNDALVADRAARAADFLFTIEVRDMLLDRFNDPDLSIGGGISAIPSIHNAMAVLFALVGYRFNRVFGLCMSAFAALIWLGSVYLNWHYAIDGIVGAAGAIGLWYGAGFLTGPAHAKEPAAERVLAGGTTFAKR